MGEGGTHETVANDLLSNQLDEVLEARNALNSSYDDLVKEWSRAKPV